MSESSKDAGVIAVLLERFEHQRLPRALAIKERVDRGERLASEDVEFLKRVLEDAREIQPLLDRHPEYEQLVAQAVHLYKEITEQSLKNEKQA